MAASKIPEEIKKHRPDPCTEVKLISWRTRTRRWQRPSSPSASPTGYGEDGSVIGTATCEWETILPRP